MALEIFKLVGSIFVDGDQAEKSIGKTDKKAQGFGKTLANGIGTAAKWSAGIVAGAGAAATGLVALTTKSSATCDTIDKMSQKIGISRQAYQEWDYVCSQSGMDVDKLQVGMKTLTTKMADARNGGKKAVAAFEALGLSIYDSTGNLKDQETMLRESIIALQGMDNATERASLASQLLGKAGVEMAPLLNSGANSVKELTQKAHDLGMVISDDTVNAGVKLTDTIDTLKRSVGAVITRVGGALMPVVQKVADKAISFLPRLSHLFTKMEPVISGLLDKLLPPLLDMADSIFPALVSVIMTLAPIVTDIVTALVPVVQEILPVIVNIIKMLAPIIAQVVEAVLPVLVDLIRQIMPIISKLAERLLPLIARILPPILELLGPLFELLSPIFDLILEILDPLFDLLDLILPPLVSLITGILQKILPALKSALSGLASVIGTVVKGAINGIMAAIRGMMTFFDSVLDFFRKFGENFKKIWSGIGDFFRNLWQGICNFFKVPINWVIDGINKFIAGINKIKIPDWVPLVGGKGFSIKALPKLEAGGVLEKGQTGYLEGNGAEAVVPLENNRKWIHAVAQDIEAETGGTSSNKVISLLAAILDALEYLVKMGIYLDKDVLVGALAGPMDRRLGQIAAQKARG